MLNRLEDYARTGRKAAEARWRRDEATALEHSNRTRRAIALESTREDRQAADKAYREAYAAEWNSRDAGLRPD